MPTSPITEIIIKSIARLLMLIVSLLLKLFTVFHPEIEDDTRYNYNSIYDFKTCHFSISFLSTLRAIKSGITVAMIPKNKAKNLILEGLAN